MYSGETIRQARAKARKAKRSIRDYLPGGNSKRKCNCTKCWPYGFMWKKQTIGRHRKRYGVHPEFEAQRDASLASLLADITNPSVASASGDTLEDV
ncbi:unnamed protein product [Rhizoctonia solani]|uniref:Uncharacterized protein n=1 Tax=Rhizoctonia solani TaxID=456999 RepID=A0A8H3HID9_9AGAM|nr:unnamed protein product [Rhizoctonia solani]